MEIAIIGGGAAGFFSAINAKENHPNSRVVIFEKSQKTLTKVKISGGGRCNVTNGTKSINELHKAYPRGGKKLKSIFHEFNTVDTINWFESRGVPLYTQDDNRVFPKSNNSQSIIDCLFNEIKKLSISIELGVGISEIGKEGQQLKLFFKNENLKPQLFDKVIVASGGSPKKEGLFWLEKLGHKIEPPVPSLFTFNMPNHPITKLMGLVAEPTLVSIQGSKLKSSGPLLITHWGMSGPAILKLSAFGARLLHEKKYDFNVQVNWVNESNNEKINNELKQIIKSHPKKGINNIKPYKLPERLWNYIIEKSKLPTNKKWGELGSKGLNKLVNLLSNDIYPVLGKTTFKEEFVTCGGISLESISLKNMESKSCKNLYFAGEILDIDAITGGYNFQAAWSTAFIAGKLNSN
ncbi:MAG: aminoacetone oxidase family FAD-binding enzyme [Crocinitomicaceae bacterium]|nr:aminoacetone oxidase family FAD-binding enzyme [Crocinitomicaceae bacterium]|tara:strand:- start:5855 stop:7075 length:1221 start_codon:yes stop_codon:yes gene_type:complete